jgi:polyhydroxyalkanoate synthase subunit PhaC
LLNQGLDFFTTDWGIPSTYDKSLTIGHFVNRYLDKAIDLIRKITKSDKVSLFGYCWGGDLAIGRNRQTKLKIMGYYYSDII